MVASKVLSKSILGILSQGLNACGGFITTLLLAHILNIADFGRFSIVYVSLFLFQTPVMALICEPMLTFSGTRYRDNIGRYMRVSMLLGIALSVTISVILAALLILFGDDGWPISGALLALPAICFYTTVRLGGYARGAQIQVLIADLLYVSLSTIGLLGAYQFDALNSNEAFIVIAVANALAGASIFLTDKALTSSGGHKLSLAQIAKENLHFGRWLIGYHSLNWGMQTGAIPIAGAFMGLEAAGGLRALQTLTQPYIQLMASLILLSIPAATQCLAARGERPYAYLITKLLIGFTGSALIYYVALDFFARTFVGMIFPSEYLSYNVLLPYLGANLIFQALAAAAAVYCRGREQTRLMFIGKAASVSFMLACGYALTFFHGLHGLGILIAGSAFVNTAILMLAFYFRPLNFRDQIVSL